MIFWIKLLNIFLIYAWYFVIKIFQFFKRFHEKDLSYLLDQLKFLSLSNFLKR
ncbi:hypothetical protein RIEPE_0141 [Candidatus Riesia pediculicola USDA]|uniref:Uncharacterized protein n=1 Tax=Riesia pediculicola (strain USDA) TaxID=515618 RepID=D4G7U9_RIEPU|nr:hypothetical protein RIEPE_0141 [Candidatus Riesia pediculicola USDA]